MLRREYAAPRPLRPSFSALRMYPGEIPMATFNGEDIWSVVHDGGSGLLAGPIGKLAMQNLARTLLRLAAAGRERGGVASAKLTARQVNDGMNDVTVSFLKFSQVQYRFELLSASVTSVFSLFAISCDTCIICAPHAIFADIFSALASIRSSVTLSDKCLTRRNSTLSPSPPQVVRLAL